MIRRKKLISSQAQYAKRKRKLAPISARRIKKMEEYGKLRKIYLLEKGYFCEVCGKLGDQIHHKSGRGKNLCAVNTFMAVCGFCHRQIHDNPAWAKEKGYLVYDFKTDATAKQ